MADDQTSGSAQQTTSGIIVPPQVRQQHPVLIELILGSESMNDEERQYWIEILPLMTPDQVKQLNDILKTEKEQLSAIDAKYGKQLDDITNQKRSIDDIGKVRKSQSTEREAQEKQTRSQEESAAENILKEME